MKCQLLLSVNPNKKEHLRTLSPLMGIAGNCDVNHPIPAYSLNIKCSLHSVITQTLLPNRSHIVLLKVPMRILGNIKLF